MGLNEAQHDAVNTLEGPLLVLAGAGTGKTRVVTFRIAKLIERGTDPSRILAVTFTKKAAREMLERATELLGSRSRNQRPEISTFHSLCVNILRRQATKLGYPARFGICDRGDQEAFARTALREINIPGAVLKPGDLLTIISNWKNASIRPDQAGRFAESDKEHLAAAAYRRYQMSLKTSGLVDFDDLLLCTEELFERFPEVRDEESDRFDHLLVDEYQDTNGSQYRIVKSLALPHRNLCVVGDDDQSIYAWRGAEVTHILRFRHDWPDAKVVRLETNYRSTHEIVGWANKLIEFNSTRHDKTLRATFNGEKPRILQLADEELEAESIVEEIHGRIRSGTRRASEIAILFRTNEQPRVFEAELRRFGVPYILLGGNSFYDRKEVRDLLAYLKVTSNPRDDVSLLRILNTPPRGIGQTTVRRMMEVATGQEKPLWEVIKDPSQVEELSARAIDAVNEFRETMDHFHRRRREPVENILRMLIERVGYMAEIERNYPEMNERETRLASVGELLSAASLYDRRDSDSSLVGFLQESTLDVPMDNDKESKLQADAVALMTLHSAKGLEFPEVYMVGLEEGILPHRRSVDALTEEAIDEERRLCYVGVTRAQRRLTLSLALQRTKWGKPRDTLPSRYLFELTGKTENPKYWEVQRKSIEAGQRGKRARQSQDDRPAQTSQRRTKRRGK